MRNEIIDAHAHLGDILYGYNIIFKQNIQKRDYHDLLERVEDNLMNELEEFDHMDPEEIEERCLNENHARNGTATLQNMQISLEKNRIGSIWVLPITPHVCFEDILAASLMDKRIVPFTCIDFSLKEQAGNKLIADVKNGAKGLKIHPILQRKSLLSKDVLDALSSWESTRLPVIVHSHPYQYYFPEEAFRNAPEFGSNYDLLNLAEMFPKINFIAAHAGGWLNYGEILKGAHLKNLYVDTSFRKAAVIEQFLESFGPERVMFGSDWPWGRQEAPLQIIKEVCKGDEELENILFHETAMRLIT